MRPRRLAVIVLYLVAALGAFGQSPSGPKVALVIGNGAYAATPLKNPPNDAKDISASLTRLGFSVTNVVDGDQKQMKRAIDDFGDKCKGASIALFYYSGHGVQVNGENWLIPVKSEIGEERDVEYEGVQLGRVLNAMEAGGAGTSIVILDACRNNPFPGSARSAARGLAVVGRKPPESVIIYSTEAGETAQDGDGRNGTFTSALLKNLERADLSLNGMLMAVNADVRKLTDNRQRPARYDNLTRDIFLNPQPVSAVSPEKARAQALVQGGAGPDAQQGSAQQSGASVSVTAAKKPSLVVQRAYGSVKIETKMVGTLFFGGEELGEIRPGAEAVMNDIEAGPTVLEMKYADGSVERLNLNVTKNSITLASFVQGGAAAGPGDPNVPRSGLVGEWLLDGNARDTGGGGYHGLVTGAKPTEDRFGRPGRAYKFEGKDYIKVVNSPGLNFGKGAFTVAFWVKTSGNCGNDSDDYFISKYKDDSSPGWSIKERDAGLALLTNDSKWEQTFADKKVNDGSWKFVVVERKADGRKVVYQDLAKGLDYAADLHDVSNDADLLFSRDGKDNWNAVCSLDDIRIYNRPLNDAELVALYREGGWNGPGSLQPQDNVPRSGLVAEWLFDGNARDSGGGGLNGVVTGAKPADDRFGRSGRAYKFEGKDYIKVASAPALNFGKGAFTVAFWLKASGNCGNESDDYFISKYRNDNTHGWSIKERDGGIALLTNEGKWDQTFADKKINDGVWRFVVLERRADGQKLEYVDMSKVLDYKADPHDISNDQDLLFARNAMNDWNASCALDDVRIYNRALGEAELDLLYHDQGWAGGGAAARPADSVPRSGLVAEYLFNGDARDTGGYGYNGTVTGAVGTANRFGAYGQALAFNGTKDMVKVPSRSGLNFGTGAYSVAFWLKAEGNCGSDSDDYFVAKYTKDDGNGWTIKERDGSLGLLTTAGKWEQTFEDDKINDGKWRFVTAIRRADGHKTIYVDMAKVLDYDADPHDVSNDTDLVFGRNEPFDSYAKCALDDVRIYNRALSEDEVAMLFREGGWSGGGRARLAQAAAPRTGLVAEYLFNGDAKDTGGNGYNGTVKGAKATANRFGKTGQALAFSGSKDMVKVPSRSGLNFGTSAYSVAFWLKTEGNCGSDSDDYFIAKYTKDDGNGWSIKERDGSLGLLTTASKWEQTFETEKVNDGKWRLIVVIRRADGQKIVYNDLDKVLDYKADAHNVSNDADLVFARNEPYDAYAKCSMDDVRFYNRALSEDEVSAIFHEGGWMGN